MRINVKYKVVIQNKVEKGQEENILKVNCLNVCQ